MGLPEPNYSLTIPSIRDDTPLDCRIYHPRRWMSHQDDDLNESFKRGAIIAHPYAPLGGCYDDPIVCAVASEILKKGFVVGTFNFRGAGTSQGKTSWTGKAELDDYVSFAGFFIHYLHGLQAPTDPDYNHQTNLSPNPPTQPRDAAEPPSTQFQQPIQLILGGYSYGSLIVSHLPPTTALLERFARPADGSAAAEILLRARTLSSQSNQELRAISAMRGSQNKQGSKPALRTSTTLGGEETPSQARRISRETRRSGEFLRNLDIRRKIASIRRKSSEQQAEKTVLQSQLSDPPAVSIYYLLISPLLPPTSTLLAPSLSRHAQKGRKFANLVKGPTLAIFGGKDFFTSVKKLRLWAQSLRNEPGSRFECREIAGAGHFWHEQGVEAQLKEAIRGWITGLPCGS